MSQRHRCDLHRLGVCGHVIVGYNVAIGGDEEAGTFADHYSLRLLAFGKKELEGASDERCDHHVSQDRAPLSPIAVVSMHEPAGQEPPSSKTVRSHLETGAA